MVEPRKSKTPPIWERAGFTTRNQYRNSQVRQLTNPATGKPYTSYRQYRDAKAKERGTPRDYALERERSDIRARSQGFENARARREANRRRSLALSVGKAEAFAKWNVTESSFNRMRAKNRAYNYEGQYTSINTYDTSIDKDLKNYSDERVGYIVSFYHAIVDPKFNYWSLFDKSANRRIIEYGKPKMNIWQYKYLVEYAHLYSVNEYEARYGLMGV